MKNNRAVERGRDLVEWCLTGPHRFGDLYVAVIYFFVVMDWEVAAEGFDYLYQALSRAKREHGCGYHVVPERDKAERQTETVRRNILRLSMGLKLFAAAGVNPADPKKRAEVERHLWLAFKTAGATPDDATVLTDYFLLGPRTLRRAIMLNMETAASP